jgi:hypothetical protein
MIKKTANIAIVILLLIATSGVPVTRHYCGRSLMSFSIYSTPKACCEGSCDKCHSIFKFSKVNDNFMAGSSVATQPLTDYSTFQTPFIAILIDISNISHSTDLVYQRAAFNYRAGHSPASSGNFRC